MNKTAIFLASFTLFLPVFSVTGAAQQPVDTIKIIDNVKEITVSRRGNTTTVYAAMTDSLAGDSFYRYEVEVDNGETMEFSDSWGLDLPFYSRRSHKDCDNFSNRIQRDLTGFEHLYWGWRFNYHDRGNVKNCFEAGVRNLVGVSWNHGPGTVSFEMGIGFGLMRMLADDGFVYHKDGDAVTLSGLGAVDKVDKSRLDIWRFHVPVLMRVPIGKHCNFSIGGVVNLNTYAKIMTQTLNGDTRKKITYKGLQQNLLTADAFASFSIGGFGLYATWSPMSLFKKQYGPELRAWSIGLDLFTF